MGSKGGDILGSVLHIIPEYRGNYPAIACVRVKLPVCRLILQYTGGVLVHDRIRVHAALTPHRRIYRVKIHQRLSVFRSVHGREICQRCQKVHAVYVCRIHIQRFHGLHQNRRVGVRLASHQIFAAGSRQHLNKAFQLCTLLLRQLTAAGFGHG